MLDKQDIENRLTPHDRRRIFEGLGVDLGRKKPNADGWINGLRRPTALGQDDKPGFGVNIDTGAVKDFDSDYSNDLYGFVQDVRRCTFPEALEIVASYVGVTTASAPVREPDRRADVDPEEVRKWSRGLVAHATPEAEALLEYLIDKRWLSIETIENHCLGIRRYMRKTWLFIPVAWDDESVTSFKMIAFNPRTGDWLLDADGKKIMQAKGSGLYLSDCPVCETKSLLQGEGEIDALLAWQSGFNATTGTAGAGTFKNEWVDLVKANPASKNGVVIAYDGDESGRTGARKAAVKLAAGGLDVRIALLPEGMDVSDVLRQDGGVAALETFTEEAEEFSLQSNQLTIPNDTRTIIPLGENDLEEAKKGDLTAANDTNDTNDTSLLSKEKRERDIERLLHLVGEVDFFHDSSGCAYADILEVSSDISLIPLVPLATSENVRGSTAGTDSVLTIDEAIANDITIPPSVLRKRTLAVDSPSFTKWLRRRFYAEHGCAPSEQSLKDCTAQVAAKAEFGGEERPVYRRIAHNERRVYLDLCNKACEVVVITSEEWSVTSTPLVSFVRPPSMQLLPSPERGGDLSELRPLLNANSDGVWIQVVSFLVAMFQPSGTFPILAIQGEQGSAKSTMSRFIRAMFDPNVAPLRRMPSKPVDVFVAASNGYVVSVENISSGVPTWLSDTLCTLASGGGIGKRTLYSDYEESALSVKCPAILNGIDNIALRGDLADRCLSMILPPLEAVMPEAKLCAEYERVRPRVLGALLDAVVMALNHIEGCRLDTSWTRPRLADFAEWVVAACPALPSGKGRVPPVRGRESGCADARPSRFKSVRPASSARITPSPT